LKTRVQPEAIIEKPQHAAILLGQGKKIAEIVRTLGITPRCTETQAPRNL
jgi:hypothetical protein